MSNFSIAYLLGLKENEHQVKDEIVESGSHVLDSIPSHPSSFSIAY
jgi:hypothetical protein